MIPLFQAGLITLKSWTRHWFWRYILVPFLLIRIALLVAAFAAQIFPTSKVYDPLVLQRGWEYNSNVAIDVWGHWDARWYISIIQGGYSLQGPVNSIESNIAFFPLYPYLVKVLAFPIDPHFDKIGPILVVGALVSSVFLLAALYLLVKLIRLVLQDEEVAEKSVLYLLLFPTGFLFSALYTESTFLFFLVSAFYTARQGRWLLAGLSIALATLTRPIGVLIVLPAAVLYLESIGWKLNRIRPNLLWLGLGPAALLAFMAAMVPISGDFFSIFKAQTAWEKTFTLPWDTILRPLWPTPIITPIDQVAAVLFLVLSVVALFRLPSLSYGLGALALLAPPLFSGQILSLTRYCSVLFPCFILLAMLGKHRTAQKAIQILFFTLQIIFMIAWSRFYWVQ